MPNSNTPETTETKAIRTVSGALDVLNAKLGGTAGDIPADATKVDALKKVYATLGGTHADVADISTTSEMIEKLAAVAEGGGGGGDSDFSTAVVTMNVTEEQNAGFTGISNACVVYDESILTTIFPDPTVGMPPVTIVLYKGSAVISISSGREVTAEGNIELDGEEYEGNWEYNATITGDCTINVKVPSLT